MYALVKNNSVVKYPYTKQDLKKDNSSVSFPSEISEELLLDYGVLPVIETEKPKGEVVEETTPAFVDGVLTQQWRIRGFTPEEREERYIEAANGVRHDRDYLLYQTDWMALSDNILTPEWANYRQALRDVPQQEGFPFDVIWPTKPE